MKKKITIAFTDEELKTVDTISALFASVYNHYYDFIDNEKEKDITNGKEIKAVLASNLKANMQLSALIRNYHEHNYDTEP